MTETEIIHIRELKSEVSMKLARLWRELPETMLPILATDARLRAYVEDVCTHPERHNLYELLGMVKFFRLREKGYKWNAKRVKHFLKVTQGFQYVDESGVTKITWSSFQVFVFANIFGWAKDDCSRLTTQATLLCPRKTGKTSMIAALGGYEVLYGVANAQVYVGSNSYNQSKICFDMIRGIIKAVDPDESFTKVNRERLWIDTDKRHTIAECLSDSPKRLDGLNASLIIMDEYSQARNTETKSGAALKNVLTSSMGVRKEPLTIVITTASEVLDGPFYSDLENIKSMLRGDMEDDDEMFASVFMPDVDDDIGNPDVWRKVHPHLGITVRMENYERWWKAAQTSADELLTFKTKQLNIFCINEQTRWISAEDIEQHQLEGLDIDNPKVWKKRMDCMVAIDLSVKDDFSAVTYIMHDKSGHRFLSHTDIFIPEETVQNHRNKALYELWIADGWMHVIKGKVNDPVVIAETIIKRSKYPWLRIENIGFDPWKADECTGYLKTYLQNKRKMKKSAVDLLVVPVQQSIGQFNKPKEVFESALYRDMIYFDKNPIIPWNFSNAILIEDNNRNQKPYKAAPHLKIDGVITNLMALSLFWKVNK